MGFAGAFVFLEEGVASVVGAGIVASAVVAVLLRFALRGEGTSFAG